ncbi:MAG: hypothetical protein P8R02_14540 [Pseudomonadales bacterium]|nr:hypothetical protein [Pseudomonadales bacterium]
MTNFELVPFGAGILPLVSGSLIRTAKHLHVEWHVNPLQRAIAWPSSDGMLRRQDELWKSTCFEIFVSEPVSDSIAAKPYFELNISPSGSWQCYRFEDYRQGQSVSNTFAVTQTSASHSAEHYSLRCTVEYSLPQFVTTSLDISVSAILKTQSAETLKPDGDRSAAAELNYYALSHPNKQPDFHLSSNRQLLLECE